MGWKSLDKVFLPRLVIIASRVQEIRLRDLGPTRLAGVSTSGQPSWWKSAPGSRLQETDRQVESTASVDCLEGLEWWWFPHPETAPAITATPGLCLPKLRSFRLGHCGDGDME